MDAALELPYGTDLPPDIDVDLPAPAAPAPRVKTFKVVNFIEAENLKGDLTYSLANLSDAMQQQASLYVHYAMLAAKAAKQVDDAEMMVEVTESKVDRVVRDKAALSGTKITEAQIDKQIARHPQVIAFKRAVSEAKQVEAICKAAAKGFEQRRDMLIQHGASERKERDGELRTMAPGSRRLVSQN